MAKLELFWIDNAHAASLFLRFWDGNIVHMECGVWIDAMDTVFSHALLTIHRIWIQSNTSM